MIAVREAKRERPPRHNLDVRCIEIRRKPRTGPRRLNALHRGGAAANGAEAEPFTVAQMAKHCGVSSRTLQKAFEEYRGITPVAHARNQRLDHAHRALEAGEASVAEIAARYAFGSSTTFALEYRKRFGVAPSRTKHTVRA